MTIKKLKEVLQGLPDDMIVVVPNHSYRENGYKIDNGCHIISTVAILGDVYEGELALCLNASLAGQNIVDQLKDPHMFCEKLLV